MILIDDTSTRAELAEAIGYVRTRAAGVTDEQTKAELAETVDDLLDRYMAARS